MAKYFHIMSGLRGCYMPDNHYTIKVSTRRELKRCIESELCYQADECNFNYRKGDIAWAAARMWRGESQSIIPFGSGKSRTFSVEIASATRAEWKENNAD